VTRKGTLPIITHALADCLDSTPVHKGSSFLRAVRHTHMRRIVVLVSCDCGMRERVSCVPYPISEQHLGCGQGRAHGFSRKWREVVLQFTADGPSVRLTENSSRREGLEIALDACLAGRVSVTPAFRCSTHLARRRTVPHTPRSTCSFFTPLSDQRRSDGAFLV